jgi:hypothetical protein
VWKARNIPHNCLKYISLGFPIKLEKAVCCFYTAGKPDGTDTPGQSYRHQAQYEQREKNKERGMKGRKLSRKK